MKTQPRPQEGLGFSGMEGQIRLKEEGELSTRSSSGKMQREDAPEGGEGEEAGPTRSPQPSQGTVPPRVGPCPGDQIPSKWNSPKQRVWKPRGSRAQQKSIPQNLGRTQEWGQPLESGCDELWPAPVPDAGSGQGGTRGPEPRKVWSLHVFPHPPYFSEKNLIFLFEFSSLTVYIILGKATKNFTSFLFFFAWVSCFYVLRQKPNLKSSYRYSSDYCLRRQVGSEPYYVPSLSPAASGLMERTISPLQDDFLLIFTRCRSLSNPLTTPTHFSHSL